MKFLLVIVPIMICILNFIAWKYGAYIEAHQWIGHAIFLSTSLIVAFAWIPFMKDEKYD